MSVRNRILGPPVPKMPFGLLELMDGLARDVLKNNPENIYEFCARHMQKLLEIRDGRAPRTLMTLEQKIEIAQKKVKQRAEERRLAYDKKIAEDTNKKQAPPAAENSRSGDNLDCSEKKETHKDFQPEVEEKIIKEEEQVIEKVAELNRVETQKDFIDIQPEVEEKVIKGEEEVEKAAEPHNELKNKTNGQSDVLNKVVIEDLKEIDDETKSDLEVLTVIESNENEQHSMAMKDEFARDDSTKDSNVEKSVLKEIQDETTCGSNMAGNDTATEPLPDESTINIESNDNAKEIIIAPENTDIDLRNEKNEIKHNNGSTEIQKEDESNNKNSSEEIQSSDTIEKVATSDDNLGDNSHLSSDAKENEKPIDGVLSNNSLNDDNKGTSLNSEENNNLKDKKVDNIDEPEKSPDDQILTVLIGSDTENVSNQASEPDVIQPNELDSVQIIVTESIPNEVEAKSEQSTDVESVPESAHDNDKTNNSSMDLETAAITIQKVFRSFLFKTKTASYDDPTTVDIALLTEDKEKEVNEVPNIKDRRHLGISRMDTVLQTVNEEKSLSLSTDDSSTLSSAATIIQAHVRGFLVRNKMNPNKTISSNSLVDSDAPSIPSLEADSDNIKSKTILNIHIVPEGSHFVSRDESILTSMDLSLDSSPPSSVNLHPLGYDKSERRKQLKREDAIQSVSPPSNNSGKLSEDHDSVKELLIVESKSEIEPVSSGDKTSVEAQPVLEKDVKTIVENDSAIENSSYDSASDEMDVVTPFAEGRSSRESVISTKLLHSGEFHDIVVPTNVTRSDTSVVRGE